MAAGYDGDGNRIFQVTRNARDFKATNPLEEELVAEQIKSPNTGDNNWYLEAFLYGVWQGTANNLAAFNSSLAVKYTEDLRDEWDEIYHGRVYDKEAGEIDFSKEDLSLLKKAGLSDEDIDTITAQEIDDKKLKDEEKITIPGATYDVSEKYYDLTRYVNDVNTENTEVLQEYTQSGNLKSSHVYGNERIYSDVYDPESDTFNISIYNYDGRRSVAQTVTDTGMESQLSYDPFGNLLTGETVGASTYGFNAEETNTLTGLQYLRARYYDTSGGRFITADDYLGNIQQPLTLNRYAYTANNPVKYNDPTGHFLGLAAYGIKRVVDHAVSTAKKAVNIVKKTNKFIGTSLKTAAAVTSMISPTVGRAVNSVADSYINKSSSGKGKFINCVKKVNKSVVETFVDIMGAGVQLAVGSSQIKRHLDFVKKKIVQFYCGAAEKFITIENINKNEQKMIESWNQSYGFSPRQYMLISNCIKSLEDSYDNRFWRGNAANKAHFVYGTLASLCGNYDAKRFYLTSGSFSRKKAIKNLQKAGVADQAIDELILLINEQHKWNDNSIKRKKDFAHKLIQYTTFSYGSSTNTGGWIRRGIEAASIYDGLYTLNYEISFKGDIDSTRWGYNFEHNNNKLNFKNVDWRDFNSDIDAINIYNRMKNENDYSEKIISDYNAGISSLKVKPVVK